MFTAPVGDSVLLYPVQYWADTTTWTAPASCSSVPSGSSPPSPWPRCACYTNAKSLNMNGKRHAPDRLEAEMAKLKRHDPNQYMKSLTEAQRAVTDAISKVNQQRRGTVTPPQRSRRELAEIEHLLTDTVSLADQLQRMTDRVKQLH